MAPHETQSFFTPEVHGHYREPILASSYNLAHTLLKRSGADHLFVPIRSMQYLAIIEPTLFWFVDSMAYAVEDGEGGRIITLCWKPEIPPSARDNLEQPVPATVTHYGADQSAAQTRLRGEFLQAMQLLDQRYRDRLPRTTRPRILPFRGGCLI
jgi:hypothetical protein